MKFIQWLLSIFIFLFICVSFLNFGNFILNIVLMVSMIILVIEVLVQKYTKHY